MGAPFIFRVTKPFICEAPLICAAGALVIRVSAPS